MKTSVIKTMLIATAFTGVIATANADTLTKSQERALVRVCEAIQDNKPLGLHRAIKYTGIKARTVLDGIRCNGMSATAFAIASNATDMVDYIVARSSKNNDVLVVKNES